MQNVTQLDAGITADDVRLALRIWTDYCHTVGLEKPISELSRNRLIAHADEARR
jgi:hypothetical protein